LTISIIVAVSENNTIGKNNRLPWSLPADLKYFKNTTWGMPVVMGRKTFDSIGKPLPGRKNIILTRNKQWKKEGVEMATDVHEAVKKATTYDVKEIFIIGGAEIFKVALPMTQRVYLTRIHANFDGDVFFPELPETEWRLARRQDCEPDEKNVFSYSFQVWERKQGNRQSL